MIKYLDNFLNSTTMYKLVLYCLMVVAVFGILFGFLGKLPFSGWSMLLSALVFIFSCYGINIAFSKILQTPATGESSVISALILFLLFDPVKDIQGYLIIVFVSFVAMGSKYVIALNKKHVFNPAAFAAVVFGFSSFVATWWVANVYMLPVTTIVGLLILRKTRRFYVFFAFLLGFFATYYTAYGLADFWSSFREALVSWPIIFFGTVMLVEPTTMPPRIRQQIIYGFLIGLVLGDPFKIISGIYTTPEITLILANIGSFFLGLKKKIKMVFQEKVELANNAYEFTFKPDQVMNFRAGQYMEWSLPHTHQDARGIRRYFTIASAPHEKFVKLGIKFNEYSSTFKKDLQSLEKGQVLFADNLMGDFFLPTKIQQKYVFIAGGIGVTPFASMLRDLMNKNRKEDIVLFYANKTKQDTAYTDLLKEAEAKLGIKVVYLMDEKSEDADEVGFLNKGLIQKYVPDFTERVFYLSGPSAMVDNYKALIRSMGIPYRNIKRDYFPGF